MFPESANALVFQTITKRSMDQSDMQKALVGQHDKLMGLIRSRAKDLAASIDTWLRTEYREPEETMPKVKDGEGGPTAMYYDLAVKYEKMQQRAEAAEKRTEDVVRAISKAITGEDRGIDTLKLVGGRLLKLIKKHTANHQQVDEMRQYLAAFDIEIRNLHRSLKIAEAKCLCEPTDACKTHGRCWTHSKEDLSETFGEAAERLGILDRGEYEEITGGTYPLENDEGWGCTCMLNEEGDMIVMISATCPKHGGSAGFQPMRSRQGWPRILKVKPFLCPVCNRKMLANGASYKCSNCGNTELRSCTCEWSMVESDVIEKLNPTCPMHGDEPTRVRMEPPEKEQDRANRMHEGIARTIEEAESLLHMVGLPATLWPSFTLEGSGGVVAYSKKEFDDLIRECFRLSVTHECRILGFVSGAKEVMKSRYLPRGSSVEEIMERVSDRLGAQPQEKAESVSARKADRAACTVEEAEAIVAEIGFPVILIPSLSLDERTITAATDREEFNKQLPIVFGRSPVHEIRIVKLGPVRFLLDDLRQARKLCGTVDYSSSQEALLKFWQSMRSVLG
jgi:hypothetical protein